MSKESQDHQSKSSSRVRRTNFSSLELEILTSEVCRSHDFLFGKLSATVTAAGKKKMWQDIANKLSANSTTGRDSDEIRKKWTDLRSQVKKKEMGRRREMKKTGGGPCPPSLTDVEQRVASIIPDCQLEGIDGGLETPIIQASVEVHVEGRECLPEGETVGAAEVPTETADHEGLINVITESPVKVTPQRRHTQSKKRKVQTGPSCNCTNNEIDRVIAVEEKKVQLLTELVQAMKERNQIEKEKIEIKKMNLSLNMCNEITPVIEF